MTPRAIEVDHFQSLFVAPELSLEQTPRPSCRLFTANDPDSTGIARSVPELETLTLVAVQQY
jgi:hypothetical protein